MARPGISKNDVFEAANQLVGRGLEPTIELVRGVLGTGSNSTIAGFLREWRMLQTKGDSELFGEDLPHEMMGLMKGLWQRLSDQADHKVAAAQEESKKELAHLREEVEKYKSNNQRWQKMMEQWQQEKTALSNEKLTLEQALEFAHKENASLAAKQDAQLQQLQDKQVLIDELHRLHQQTQENLEHFRESTRQQRLVDEEKQANAMQQVESALKLAEQQLLIANKDKAILQQRLEQVTYENAALEKSTVILSDKLNITETSFLKLQKEQGIAEHEAVQLQRQCDALIKKQDEQSEVLIEQQKKNAAMMQQLSMLRDEVTKLEEQNKLLAREKWEIAQEKAHIEGANRQIQEIARIKEVL